MVNTTHAVVNQVPPLQDIDLFASDIALREAVSREGAAGAIPELALLGADLGRSTQRELARLANVYPPVLHTHDPQGHRIDRVEFHPAWHELMRGIVARGFHASPWRDPKPGAHVARAAGYLMQAQVESGTLCPTTMTYGAVALLRRYPDTAGALLPAILSAEYDAHDKPVHLKRGALVGMGLTEKQGGSDVRANLTRAERQPDGSYRITGHKWFFSAPQCDAHLVLAQAEGGPTCFLMPRWMPDGERNAMHIQRLKDKLGNRSNASSEVEFHAAWALRLGEEGRGIPVVLEMGNYTRLDCVIGSAGLMRHALVQAIHHARHRHAFGQALVEQSLMQNVLADLALESEAATALALRLARAFDGLARPDSDAQPAQESLYRVLTPAAKFWVCKRAIAFVAEAMEVLGGNGYVEEGTLARLYREAPVNSIWEGSGNIMCLDVLRSLHRQPQLVDLLEQEWAEFYGLDRGFDRACSELLRVMRTAQHDEATARRIAARLVIVVQAALLWQSATPDVAAAFCASRLAESGVSVFGMLEGTADHKALIERAWPE